MKKLPKTPSKLLTIALNDLTAVERSKLYTVNMHRWHIPTNNIYLESSDSKVCQVCLAGSVMAKTLKADPGQTVSPTCFSFNENKLLAINELREGNVSYACEILLDVKVKKDDLDRFITPYEDDPKEFKKEMRKLIKDLEKAGM